MNNGAYLTWLISLCLQEAGQGRPSIPSVPAASPAASPRTLTTPPGCSLCSALKWNHWAGKSGDLPREGGSWDLGPAVTGQTGEGDGDSESCGGDAKQWKTHRLVLVKGFKWIGALGVLHMFLLSPCSGQLPGVPLPPTPSRRSSLLPAAAPELSSRKLTFSLLRQPTWVFMSNPSLHAARWQLPMAGGTLPLETDWTSRRLP